MSPRRDPWLDPGFRHEPGECLKCGAQLDAGSHPDGETPEDGDGSLCVYCGSVLVYEGGKPRMANEVEIDEFRTGAGEEFRDALEAVRAPHLNPLYGRYPNGRGPKPALQSAGVAS